MGTLCRILYTRGRVDEAGSCFSELMSYREHAAMQPNPGALNLGEYAVMLLTSEPPHLRDPESALRLARETVDITGAKDPSALSTLALAYKMTGDIDTAIETQRQCLDLLPPHHSLFRTDAETSLVSLLRDKGDFERAQAMLDMSLGKAREEQGERTVKLLQLMTELDMLFLDRDRYVLHSSLGVELTQLWRGAIPQGEQGIVKAIVAFAAGLIRREQCAEAEELLRYCLEIRKLALPEGDWRTHDAGWQVAHVMNLLGASLTGQGKFDEAQPLLLDAYNQMNDNAETIPDSIREGRLREALRRVVNLYDAWGKPDEARKYRAALSEQESVEPTEPEVKVPP